MLKYVTMPLFLAIFWLGGCLPGSGLPLRQSEGTVSLIRAHETTGWWERLWQTQSFETTYEIMTDDGNLLYYKAAGKPRFHLGDRVNMQIRHLKIETIRLEERLPQGDIL